MAIILPSSYTNILSITETQKAIVFIKDTFQRELSSALGLTRVSAPLFVDPLTGLNDNLSGSEKAVNFVTSTNKELEIVQSLAKWKRYALKEYNLSGIFTDMNAIRKNENPDNIHSYYVDQWDWEKVISKEERNLSYLKETVRKIYKAFLITASETNKKYPNLSYSLPDDVTFISSTDLLSLYPNLNAKEREYQICKKHKAVFIIGIGEALINGESHDNRASDYDDWKLNGDLLLYNEVLDIPFEISSMGIRVDASSLSYQAKVKNVDLSSSYHKAVLNNELPLTIGGGIGQSRVSMFLLKKAHIGEVQSSYWPESQIEEFKKVGIYFL